MIKKMYAVFYCGKFIGHTDEVCEDKHNGKYLYTKPVWVCDRDPFENVKKYLKKLEKRGFIFKGNNAELGLFCAIKKDLKNFDGGAG